MAQATKTVLELAGVSKKFRRGEMFDSLRDLIPELLRRVTKRGDPQALDKQEFWALRDVSFSVGQGEALGIIGSNGAGKSTMLKLLSGIMKPTLGQIRVHGKLSALIEVGAGFHPDLTGRENIFLNGAILGMSKAEIRSKFDEIVEFSGLEEFIDTPVKRYSSGMYARLGFSVAAHVDPDVLIVDEVLSVGDYLFQKKCHAKMTEVIKGGATVVFVSHNLRAVTDLCTRCVWLQRGVVRAIGPTTEIVKGYLDTANLPAGDRSAKQVVIESLAIRDATGPAIEFDSGETVWVDVTLRALQAVERIAVVLAMRDEGDYLVFDTSSQRLGAEPLSLAAGESRTVTFRLTMNAAAGTFHLDSMLHRYDIDRTFDVLKPGATFYVSADRDVRGAVNLFPVVE